MRESELHPHHPAERAELFKADNGRDAEREVHRLLAALVGCFKPAMVLETGTADGATAETIALALSESGVLAPRLVTIERDAENVARARERLASFRSVQVVEEESTTVLADWIHPEPFELAFLDSELSSRVRELEILVERRLLRGPVLIHDTSRLRAAGGRPDYPTFPDELDDACRRLGLASIECPLSRGWRLLQARG